MDELLKQILEVQSHSGKVKKMNKTIIEIANAFGCTIKVKDKSVYVTKGEPTPAGYPCMVAHTDTVHKIVPDDQYRVIHDVVHGVIYGYNPVKHEFTGIGGDDKVGLYITLYALRELPSFKAVFFRDEEIGCVGSNNADMNFFKDCMYILQCDRRNNSDFITKISGTPLSSQEFQQDILDIVSQRGYKYTDGMTTDVGALAKKQVGVSVANMSCGYYNPHSDDEIIDVAEMNNCRDMCMEIFATLNIAYPFIAPKPEPVVYNYNKGNYSGGAYQGSLYGTSTDFSKMNDAEWKAWLDQKYPKIDSYNKAPFEVNRWKWINDIDDYISDFMIDKHALIIAYGWEYFKKGFYRRGSGSDTMILPFSKFDFKNLHDSASDEIIDQYNKMIGDYIDLTGAFDTKADDEDNVAENAFDHLPSGSVVEMGICDGCAQTYLVEELDKRYHCCSGCMNIYGFGQEHGNKIF